MSYKQYETSLLPNWLLVDEKDKFFEQSGEMKDDVISNAQDAIEERFVDISSNQSLIHLSSTFNIEKNAYLTDDQYRDKLREAWDRWIKSGTENQLLKEINQLGFVNAAVVPKYVETSPGVFINYLDIPESNPSMENFWSSFYIVISKPHSYTQVAWGSFEWGDGTLWGSVAGDMVKIASLLNLIKQMKPAHTSCRGIIFLMDSAVGAWDLFNWTDGTTKYGLTGGYGFIRVLEDWEF